MITLTAPLTFGVGGVTQETADHGAAAQIFVDWLPDQGITTVIGSTLDYGRMTGSVFTSSARANPSHINVDFTTGAWSCPETGTTGTLTAQQLATLQSNLKAVRNVVESFAVSSGVMPGTQTPW